MTLPRILVTDDQPDVLEALRLLLKSEGHACVCCQSPAQALEAVKQERFDAALIDLNYTRDTTSGQEGLELLVQLKKLAPDLPVVVMTAWGTIDVAVQAMRAGAGDFIEKPWDNRRLICVLRAQVELGRSLRREAKLATENALLREDEGEEFIANSPSMRPVMDMLRRVAPSDANVLILGENGTGKGVLARHLHRLSRRGDKPLIKVNMGGIAESVFESEMFGHVKGAFTDAKGDRIGRFELADGGTLFLDEIANIPISQQPKLLRVLEDGELERLGSSRTLKVDVRLVSATNADLGADVARGAFRKDLLFRLNTVEIRLPPLRERREDIAPMARAFLARCAGRYQREGMEFSPSALQVLERYPWPGNVRELSHVIERAVLMAGSSRIEQLDFSLQPAETVLPAAPGAVAAQTLEQAEQAMVRNALDQCGGNIQKTAELLGLSRAALYRRLEKYGIDA
ncbi:MAG: sigma-54 dependent transcriptional regulator [Chiayiivirga sp.]|jgi:DNA-binding NtrC family response regulator|uniref:sigma-54-dependent transcriptional regulator n=1 Tax=Chiayiivirga sp. TaxID=2041042 RepID=UPI0025B86B94|nr:sigma-54 dependent transcriptional regulator [Chiayiivirga sp.]MCI1709598.1 sigma-54 dependent transcriptional regulator [Chiayiivirga sp.]MCI1730115.1 sigma-54 dependent transcriptional regulator [Chiayiivirga sp.]